VTARYRGSTAERGYGKQHQALRARFEPMVLAGDVRCWRCGDLIVPGEPWHLGHKDDDKSVYMGPEHERCNTSAARQSQLRPGEDAPEREGLEQSDPRWQVPWLKGLRRVPRDATWPRLMTVPHPAAVGSLGKEFCRWADRRAGGTLRWWQRLAATRMLEVDDHERLVWDAVLLSMARQLGKSWLLRELCLWRIEQGDRWGEPQDVLHTGKDLAVCIEVQRSARIWARPLTGLYQVREASGREAIEYLPGRGGRWILKAKGAPYGFTISEAVVDEAWNVETNYIEEGVAPTMVERVSPQLLLVSTAHRLSTSLMLTRRKVALEELETGTGDLLIEWSAPRGAPIDGLAGWRQASPHWTPQRQRLIQRRLDAMYAGETQDLTEVDPAESFRAQWLNQWPKGLTVLDGEELLPPGLWQQLAEPGLRSSGPVWVAVEDNFGNGAAVAVATRLDDGRIEVEGWLRQDWDSALADVRMLGTVRRIRQFQVGASMLTSVPLGTVPQPVPAGGAETRPGLAVFRDLCANRMVAHDPTAEDSQVLDDAVHAARVKETAVGLAIVTRPRALINALVWAVNAAHKPAPVPTVF
jgi:hypothetical protein